MKPAGQQELVIESWRILLEKRYASGRGYSMKRLAATLGATLAATREAAAELEARNLIIVDDNDKITRAKKTADIPDAEELAAAIGRGFTKDGDSVDKASENFRKTQLAKRKHETPPPVAGNPAKPKPAPKAAKPPKKAAKPDKPPKPSDAEIMNNAPSTRFIEAMPMKANGKEKVYEAKILFLEYVKAGIDPEMLIKAALRYAISRPNNPNDPQSVYTLNPYSWLKQRRWHDIYGDQGAFVRFTSTGNLYHDEVWKLALAYLANIYDRDQVERDFMGVSLVHLGEEAHLMATGEKVGEKMAMLERYSDDLFRAFFILTNRWRIPVFAPPPEAEAQ